MKYTITLRSKSLRPYYPNPKKVTNTYVDSYETEDGEMAKTILKDLLDVADFELTDENITKNFQPLIKPISSENMAQIKKFYGIRKILYGDFLNHFKENIEGCFRYEIPEDANHFEVNEFPDDPIENENQIEYGIELKIEK